MLGSVATHRPEKWKGRFMAMAKTASNQVRYPKNNDGSVEDAMVPDLWQHQSLEDTHVSERIKAHVCLSPKL